MLYCKECDYLKCLTHNLHRKEDEMFICELTASPFNDEIENLNIEHPCYSRQIVLGLRQQEQHA